MTKSLRKNILREIRGTWKRFLSIALMAFLGAGFFAGINASSTDMQLACDTYLDQQNCFDLQVLSTLGLTEEDVREILQVRGVRDAVGAYSENVMVGISEGDEKVKLMTISENSDINQLYLVEGEMARSTDECVVPQTLLDITEKHIGDTLEIIEALDEDEESSFAHTSLTITGVVKSPLFVFSNSGTNERSTGAVADYLYVPESNITEDYFTEIYITLDGAAQLDSFGEAYERLIDDEEVLVKAIAKTREQARYDQVTGDANADIDDAQQELDDKTAEGQEKLDDAQADIDAARREIEDGRAELEKSRLEAEKQFAKAQRQLDDAAAQLKDGWKTYEKERSAAEKTRAELIEQKKTIETALTDLQQKHRETAAMLEQLEAQRQALTDGIAQVEAALSGLNEQLTQAQTALEQMTAAGMDTTELEAQIAQLTAGIAQAEQQKTQLAAQLNQLDSGIAQTKDGLAQINAGIAQAEDGLTQIDDGIRRIDTGLAAGKAQLEQAEKELEAGRKELAAARKEADRQFADAERKLRDGQAELDDGIAQFESEKADFDRKIADAQKEIDDARAEVGDINLPTWYVLTREGNSSIASFDQDSTNLKKIGFTFPLIFFLVAVLISLSSMTRMVEEQRSLIGTFKALGYSGTHIAAKYLIYAATAVISGAILGEYVLMKIIPVVIWGIYGTFYLVPVFFTPIDWFYGILGLLACASCIIGATAAACMREVRQTPANLMRPKAPNPGKRVLIERITPLWSRFNFSQKVTLRNLFRYKKRFFMTVCGIAGCAALITTGFGLKDSIVALIPLQYDDIMHYDMIAVAGTEVKPDEFEEMSAELLAEPVVTDAVEIHAESVKIVTQDSKTHELELFVPADTEAFAQYISLWDMDEKEEIQLSGNTVMLTRQIAELLDVSAGDVVSMRREDGTKADVTIGAVVNNYMSHYAFLSEDGYRSLYGEKGDHNAFILHTSETRGERIDALTRKLNSDSRYTAVSLTQAAKDAVDDRFGMLDQVVWILITAAAALALVVLYNLSNINISERIRELATIKVLGFYDMEVYQYNTRESIVLTLIGTLIGLAGGNRLTWFILKTMEMQGIVFEPTVAVKSYIISAIVTVIFATLINFTTYFSLKKINMVEALKSVE